MRDPPDRITLDLLHERLLRGDRLASEELASLLLQHLVDRIARRFPGADKHLVTDGVVDAVLDYCANPQQFDLSKAVPLDGFLAENSWRNVANRVVSEQRRKHRERKVGREKREANVAFDPVARKIQQEDRLECDQKKAAMCAALDNPKDKEILALRLDGVRDTATFARVLGIDHLPVKQQKEVVKRHKDRIARFLRRKGLLS